jgi:2,3-bisphosphoglycerate-independent phosphoglycerate mutase
MSILYKGPLVLIVMDGVGLREDTNGNAVALAHDDTLKRLMQDYPMARLGASGEYVGIPSIDAGNSEVGHNAIGAGQIITQGPLRVESAIATGKIFTTDSWKDAIANVKSHNSTLHFIGIFSDGNVHSNIHHLEAMLKDAHQAGVTKARIHILLDGRDTPPTSALKYVKELEDFIKNLGAADYKIASGGGRMVITADRYQNDWPMVEKGWRAHVLGDARHFNSATEAIETYRREIPGLQDQYVPPFVIVADDRPVGTIEDGDSVIYYDFRADRAIEIAMAFTYDDFPFFDRTRRPDVYFVGMTEYNSDTHVPAHTLVPPLEIKDTLSEFLATRNISQLAISETVKFGHITYYFNGNHYDKFNPDLETYIEIPSDTMPFNTRPWMKSAEITDRLIAEIATGKYRFIRVNYPNGDMVGHFGELEPTITAMEAVDIALARLIQAVDAAGGMAIITADHGNAEEEIDANGQPKTSHTTNPVPCIFYDNTTNASQYALAPGDFGLANLASTIAILLGQQPLDAWQPPIIKTN